MRSLQYTSFFLLLTGALPNLCADQPEPKPQKNPSFYLGYTAPADIRLNRSWYAEFTANFTYWEALQDNMELGIVTLPSSGNLQIDGSVINNSFEYKPGFQLGLGFGSNYDGWGSQLSYTWFRSTTHTHKSISSTDSQVISPLWLSPKGLVFKSASEKWHVSLNGLDWTLSRDSRIGRRLNIAPFFGLRALWLDQQLHTNYYQSTGTPSANYYSTLSNRSWGLGPEMGIQSSWLLGTGFKLYADLEADLLYTQYTRLELKEEKETASSGQTLSKRIKQNNLSAVRPHADIELGIGWSTFFSNKAYHLDLLLGYEFQVFWDQNMFRKLTDDIDRGAGFTDLGNLYLQGLTASVCFAF